MRRAAAILLAVLVLAACSGDDAGDVVTRDDETTELPTTSGPELGDHWHLAFEVSRCGDALPDPTDAQPDTTGIHTHGDGLIHVHPFLDEVAGDGAVLARFFDTIGATVDDDGLTIGGETLPYEGECDGDAAHLVLATWDSVGGPDSLAEATRVTSPEQLRSVRLAPDRGAIAIGLTTEDTLPLPASAAGVQAPADLVPSTTVPAATGEGTPAVDVDFGFAPVLGSSDPPCGSTATPARNDVRCYELGSIGADKSSIESAEAVFNDVEWTVHLTLTQAGIDAFNALARECFTESPPCPTRMLSIVVDGEVISAPSIQTEHFERDQIQISGAFTEAEAKELAASLSP
jgi:hypothetical protein